MLEENTERADDVSFDNPIEIHERRNCCKVFYEMCQEIIDMSYPVKILGLLWLLNEYTFSTFMYMSIPYLEEKNGFNDVNSTALLGNFGIVKVFTIMVSGIVTDHIGTRWPMIIGNVTLVIGTLLYVNIRTKTMMYVIYLVIFPISMSLVMVAHTVGIQQHTEEGAARSQVYGNMYVIQNIGFVCSNYVCDWFWRLFTSSDERFTPILYTLVVIAIIGVIAAFYYPEADQVQSRVYIASQKSQKEKFNDFLYGLRDPSLWKMLWFMVAFQPIYWTWRYWDFIWPEYCTRIYGDDFPSASYISINTWMCTLMVPFTSAIVKHYALYPLIILGVMCQAGSMFILTLGQSSGVLVLYFVVFSLCEVFYSPMTTPLIMNMAKPGKEGLYSSIANAPRYCAAAVVGAISGHMLPKYVPEDDPDDRDPTTMWFLLALLSCVSPVLLIISWPLLSDAKCCHFLTPLEEEKKLKNENTPQIEETYVQLEEFEGGDVVEEFEGDEVKKTKNSVDGHLVENDIIDEDRGIDSSNSKNVRNEDADESP